MKLIKVEEASSGQKVAKDVTDLKGVLLFKAGTELNDTILQRIRARNITHIFIDIGDGDGPVTDLLRDPAAVDEELERVFGETKDHPIMAELLEAAKRYLKNRPG